MAVEAVFLVFASASARRSRRGTWPSATARGGLAGSRSVNSGKGLQQARQEARALREGVRTGRDPIAERRALHARAKAESVATLKALLDLYGQKVGINGVRGRAQCVLQSNTYSRPRCPAPLPN